MRLRFAVALVAALLLTGISTIPDSTFTKDQRIAAVVYSAACSMTGYKCTDVVPQIRRSPQLRAYGYKGLYWSAGIIWLDTGLTGSKLWLSAFHETVHVLQDRNGVLDYQFDPELDCLVEREALDYTNAYADVIGAGPSFKRTVEEWRELYDCK